jgi:proton glutamate symport protein
MKLNTKIFLGLLVGILLGLLVRSLGADAAGRATKYLFSPVGKGFLRLIQFVVVPVVLSSLIVGMSSLKSVGHVGRMGGKLVVLYIGTGIIALLIGFGAAALVQPGVGMTAVAAKAAEVKAAPSLVDTLVVAIPDNPFTALNATNMLQVIATALLLGLGITAAGEKGAPMRAFFESLYAATMKILGFIMHLAPYGVAALMASLTASQGGAVLFSLGKYLGGQIVAVLVMGLVVYSLILAAARVNVARFWATFAPAFSVAFGTASSNAALPVTMESSERFGLSKEMAGFAMPLGTTIKKDGAAILQAFTAVFVAQMAGIHLTPVQMVTVAAATLLVSFSTAGVPGAGLIMMTTVLSTVGLPLEAIGVVAGVDRLADAFRTALNVIGVSANGVLLHAWESPGANKGEGE